MLLNWLAWGSSGFIETYDEVLFMVHIFTRESLINISDGDIYFANILYALGLAVGGIIANILTNSYSVKKTMLLSQVLLAFLTVLIIFSGNRYMFFMIRLFQGFFVPFPIVCSMIIAKRSLSSSLFGQMLASLEIFTSLVNITIPKIVYLILNQYGLVALTIFTSTYILIGSIYVLAGKDYNKKLSLQTATKNAISSYKGLITSKLVMVLIIVGLTSAVSDLMIIFAEKMLSNSKGRSLEYIKENMPNIFSFMNGFSLAILNIIVFLQRSSQSESNKVFEWKNIKKTNYIETAALFLAISLVILTLSMFIGVNNYELSLLVLTILLCTMCVINYSGCRALYDVYNSPGCVANAVILFEQIISVIVQSVSQFIEKVEHNQIIFIYHSAYLVLMSGLLFAFYTKVIQEK